MVGGAAGALLGAVLGDLAGDLDLPDDEAVALVLFA